MAGYEQNSCGSDRDVNAPKDWFLKLSGRTEDGHCIEKYFNIRQLVDDYELLPEGERIRPMGRGGVTLGRGSHGLKDTLNPTSGLFHSPVMSRRHAQLVLDTPGRVHIYDRGSLNGTSVSPACDIFAPSRLKGHITRLYDGDYITLGTSVVSEGKHYTPLRLKVSLRSGDTRTRLDGRASFERLEVLPKSPEEIPWLACDKDLLKDCLSPILARQEFLWDCMDPAGRGRYGVPRSAVYDEGDDMSDDFEIQPAALPLNDVLLRADAPASDAEDEDVASEPEVMSSHWGQEGEDTPSDSDHQATDASGSDSEGDDATDSDRASSVFSADRPTWEQEQTACLTWGSPGRGSDDESEEEAEDEDGLVMKDETYFPAIGSVLESPEPATSFPREREDTPSAASVQSDVLITPYSAVDLAEPVAPISKKRSREELSEAVETGPAKHVRLDSPSPTRRGRTTLGTVGILATGAAIGAVSTVGLLASFY